MSTLPTSDPEASGSTTPEASATNVGFIAITNTIVVMLQQLAEEVRAEQPGTAEAIEAYAVTVAGQALDLIGRWPA
jgi:hypothetical protein